MLNDINKSSAFDDDSYFSQINSYIVQNKKLKNKSTIDACSEDEVSRLIDAIDGFMIRTDKHLSKIGFEKVVAMIGIKIMLFTGVRYNILRNVKVSDMVSNINIIKINGFSIRLPINLSLQIQYYEQLRKQVIENASDYFFIGFDGSQWSDKTSDSKMLLVLINTLARTDTKGITKFGLKNLILAGTDIKKIEELTGCKKDMIRSCMPADTESKEDKLNRYINMCISKTSIFYKL